MRSEYTVAETVAGTDGVPGLAALFDWNVLQTARSDMSARGRINRLFRYCSSTWAVQPRCCWKQRSA